MEAFLQSVITKAAHNERYAIHYDSNFKRKYQARKSNSPKLEMLGKLGNQQRTQKIKNYVFKNTSDLRHDVIPNDLTPNDFAPTWRMEQEAKVQVKCDQTIWKTRSSLFLNQQIHLLNQTPAIYPNARFVRKHRKIDWTRAF